MRPLSLRYGATHRTPATPRLRRVSAHAGDDPSRKGDRERQRSHSVPPHPPPPRLRRTSRGSCGCAASRAFRRRWRSTALPDRAAARSLGSLARCARGWSRTTPLAFVSRLVEGSR